MQRWRNHGTRFRPTGRLCSNARQVSANAVRSSKSKPPQWPQKHVNCLSVTCDLDILPDGSITSQPHACNHDHHATNAPLFDLLVLRSASSTPTQSG